MYLLLKLLQSSLAAVVLVSRFLPVGCVQCKRQYLSYPGEGQFWGSSPHSGDTLHEQRWNLACSRRPTVDACTLQPYFDQISIPSVKGGVWDPKTEHFTQFKKLNRIQTPHMGVYLERILQNFHALWAVSWIVDY